METYIAIAIQIIWIAYLSAIQIIWIAYLSAIQSSKALSPFYINYKPFNCVICLSFCANIAAGAIAYWLQDSCFILFAPVTSLVAYRIYNFIHS